MSHVSLRKIANGVADSNSKFSVKLIPTINTKHSSRTMDTGTYEIDSTFAYILTEPLLKIIEEESPADDTVPGFNPYDSVPLKKGWGSNPC